MLPIHTILHPTDFSERSQDAFRLACALARDYDARVIVLHVWSLPTPVVGEVVPMLPPTTGYDRTATEEKLHRLQAPDAAVRVEHRLEEGDSATEILDVAQDSGADLIVLGTHGRSRLSRLLMGSVAEQIVRRAACPVVTVRTPFPRIEQAANAAVRTPLQEAVNR
jgi:nucleotide-binding universal stress UspA family protein